MKSMESLRTPVPYRNKSLPGAQHTKCFQDIVLDRKYINNYTARFICMSQVVIPR